MNNYLTSKHPVIYLNTLDKSKKSLKTLLYFCVIIAVILVIIASVGLYINTRKDYNNIPSLRNAITNFYSKESSIIVDRNDQIIFDYRQRSKKEPLPDNDMPELMKYAILVREDENFYNSSGFSWKNFMGALLGCTKSKFTNIASDCRGGSGIYQQLVKNFDNTADRSVETKYTELLRSLKASEEITLDEALTIYLNNMDFGRLSKGVQISSRSFFNHSITDNNRFNPAKACFLALMPNQPTGYTVATKNMLKGDGDADPRPTFKWSLVKSLLDGCLDKLSTIKIFSNKPPIITEDQAKEWKKYDITKEITKEIFDANEQAKYYIKDYIEEELLSKFSDTFVDRTSLDNYLFNKKMIIKTTFDLKQQNIIEGIIKSKKDYFAKNDINQLAAAVTDNSNSELIAFIGNLNYENSQISRISGQYGYILPGSSTKPYYFAGAFDRGFNPGTKLQDGEYIDPVIGNIRSNDIIGKYEGNVSMRYGLQQSINTIAEQATYLNQDGSNFSFKQGVNNSINFAKTLGLKYQENEQNANCLKTIMIAVGNCPVQGLSHLNAFTTLANKGIYNEIKSIISIQIENKDLVNEKTSISKYINNQQVIDQAVANQTIDVLSDYETRRLRTGSRSNDAMNYEIEGWTGDNRIAVKSGTSQIFYDNKNQIGEISVIGGSNKYSTLLWAAKVDEKGNKIPIKVASSGITPIFKEIMTQIHKDILPSGFSKEGLIKVKLDSVTGLFNPNGQQELLTQKQIDILKQSTLNPNDNIFQLRTGTYVDQGCNTTTKMFDHYRFEELKNNVNKNFNANCSNAKINNKTLAQVKFNFTLPSDYLTQQDTIKIATNIEDSKSELKIRFKGEKTYDFTTKSNNFNIALSELIKGEYLITGMITGNNNNTEFEEKKIIIN
jgi:membrane peptidoglycan carboxypeptidase